MTSELETDLVAVERVKEYSETATEVRFFQLKKICVFKFLCIRCLQLIVTY